MIRNARSAREPVGVLVVTVWSDAAGCPEQRAFHDAVTGARQASGVSSEPSRTGVCVIRITAQGGRMFITLRENADVERIPADRTYKMTDVSDAVRAVHEFLTSFVAASRDG